MLCCPAAGGGKAEMWSSAWCKAPMLSNLLYAYIMEIIAQAMWGLQALERPTSSLEDRRTGIGKKETCVFTVIRLAFGETKDLIAKARTSQITMRVIHHLE
eukprot:9363054-Heterocapsa_arctica.AAC.1